MSVLAGIELTVFFGSRHGVQPSFDAGFGREVQFDVPLLEGYRSDFLPNRGSGIPSGQFLNFDCLDLGRRLAEGRFDVVWIHGWGYKAQWQALRAARKLGTPYLMRGETNVWTRSSSALRSIARRLVVGRMLRGAAACLYVGQSNRDFLRKMGVAEARLRPAHYAVDARGFRRAVGAPGETDDIRRRHLAGPDTFVVVTTAKAIPRKRIQDVIRAVGQLGPGACLWVLGDGPERPGLELLAGEVAPGRVTWHGFVNQSQMPALLAAADAFVLSSEDEPWGLAVNEAMACGLPAVCSDRVGCALDLVREGVTGYCFPVGDVRALADRLLALRADRAACRRMGRAAQELVLREYDVRATAAQIAAAVRAVVHST